MFRLLKGPFDQPHKEGLQMMIRGLLALAFSVTVAAPAFAGTLKCAADSVKVGNVCVDKYEASVWSIAPSNTGLVNLVLKGKATLADLTAGGAPPLPLAGACAGPRGHAA